MSQILDRTRVFGSRGLRALVLVGAAGAAGCGDNATSQGPGVEPPATYAFESRFEDGASSVAYAGQTFRHVLIETIDAYIGQLTERIDGGDFKPEPGDVRAVLDSYYAFDSMVSGDLGLPIEASMPLVQKKLDDLGTGKDLKAKFAGNGGDAEHADWKRNFRGYAGVGSAEALLFKLFDHLDALAVARATGEYEIDVTIPVFVTAEGHDLREFIGKLLLMGTAYSQVTDKYLDDELEASDNTQIDEDGEKEPFSALEHAWDEGFGYLGAARDYASYSDEELAGLAPGGGSYKDTNQDGKIDLMSEMNFGPAVYAAKRDLGSKDKTDFTADLWTAFATGRAIIAEAGETLTGDEKTALVEQRDAAVKAWESVIAASIVHYLNETIASLTASESGEFVLAELAEPYSELKAFSLGLQLNPRSRLSGKAFDSFHSQIGDAPVLPDAGKAKVTAYKQQLLAARKIIADTYGFAAANVGDDTGHGGW